MKIPKPNHTTINAMKMPIEQPRGHFGISLSGDKCERKLWLLYRWAVIEKFDNRMLRLFRRGHLEEYQMVKDLESAGVKLNYVLDDQLFIDFGCGVGGSPDGLALSGIVEAPKSPHLLEFKTHNDKSFKELQKHGVKTAKPKHYNQMQCYMYGLNNIIKIPVKYAFYLSVNKNDDTYYSERLDYDEEFAKASIERAKRIAMSERLPEPMCKNPSWWECKFCPAYNFCYSKQLTKEANCRTCAHVTPQKDGNFYCEKYKAVIPLEYQRKGCRAHVLHPDLVPYNIDIPNSDNWNACYNGVLNGEKGLDSKTIIERFNNEV